MNPIYVLTMFTCSIVQCYLGATTLAIIVQSFILLGFTSCNYLLVSVHLCNSTQYGMLKAHGKLFQDTQTCPYEWLLEAQQQEIELSQQLGSL